MAGSMNISATSPAQNGTAMSRFVCPNIANKKYPLLCAFYDNRTITNIAFSHLISGLAFEDGDINALVTDVVNSNGTALYFYMLFGSFTPDTFQRVLDLSYSTQAHKLIYYWVTFGLPMPANAKELIRSKAWERTGDEVLDARRDLFSAIVHLDDLIDSNQFPDWS